MVSIKLSNRLQSLSRWKGNWNSIPLACPLDAALIAEPIPMKRELKHEVPAHHGGFLVELQSLSRWKGNWNLSFDGGNLLHLFELQSLSRWKGNWNGLVELGVQVDDEGLQSLSRWKGNWNVWLVRCWHWDGCIAEPIPMKRELKRPPRPPVISWVRPIAEPIPMKRELKLEGPRAAGSTLPSLQSLSRWKGNWNMAAATFVSYINPYNCRAYPDEKGIETKLCNCPPLHCDLLLQSLSRWKGNWNKNGAFSMWS